MANSTIANLTDGVTAVSTDRIPIERSPFGTGTNRYITPGYISTLINAASTWDTISAAAASKTTANGNNTITYNTAHTTDATVSWTFGETSAATGGTVTGGFANQVLVSFETLAASTQSPLRVKVRGTTVMEASSLATQMLFDSSFSGSNPQLACAGSVNTGITFDGASPGINVIVSGTSKLQVQSGAVTIPAGTVAAPGLQNFSNTAGISFPGNISFSLGTNQEVGRFDGAASASLFRLTQGANNATGYAHQFYKSRGTVASPSVITTGDALGTMKGFGYVGATNTYLEACRIEYDSTGTIADTTSGIGGKIAFLTANQGTVGVVTAMTVQNTGDITIGLPTPATTATVGFPQLPTMSGTPTGVPTVITGFNPMVYDTTGKKIWIYDYGSSAWKGVAVV